MDLKSLKLAVTATLTPMVAVAACNNSEGKDTPPVKVIRPNILMVILDDQSYPYTSAYGCPSVSTPGFDFVAEHGAMFTNAYVTSPGSSPSRASILTGLYPWQIEEAGTHASSFPSKYICYPDIFEAKGYRVGFTGKGWGPGDWAVSGRTRNPAGTPYNGIKNDTPYSGISNIDYAANFAAFLDKTPSDKPFCFWLGTNEPHRGYQKDSWKQAGHSTDQALVPGYLPDCPQVRGDIMDYAVEIEWADKHLCNAINELKKRGMLGNTLIVVMADNGMSFPHAKANCYDAGLHVPLAICWVGKIPEGQVINENVSSIDILPTFLDAAGIEYDPGYSFSGHSIFKSLVDGKGHIEDGMLMSGRERHSCARPGNLGYPIRSFRKGDWLLIWNIHPERWPAGNPVAFNKDGTLGKQDGAYYDIDGSPTLTYMINHKTEAGVAPYFEAAVSFRQEFELYNVVSDPDCMNDLSSDKAYSEIYEEMKNLLLKRLSETEDTRLSDNPEIWETYPRLSGDMREFPE